MRLSCWPVPVPRAPGAVALRSSIRSSALNGVAEQPCNEWQCGGQDDATYVAASECAHVDSNAPTVRTIRTVFALEIELSGTSGISEIRVFWASRRSGSRVVAASETMPKVSDCNSLRNLAAYPANLAVNASLARHVIASVGVAQFEAAGPHRFQRLLVFLRHSARFFSWSGSDFKSCRNS